MRQRKCDGCGEVEELSSSCQPNELWLRLSGRPEMPHMVDGELLVWSEYVDGEFCTLACVRDWVDCVLLARQQPPTGEQGAEETDAVVRRIEAVMCGEVSDGEEGKEAEGDGASGVQEGAS